MHRPLRRLVPALLALTALASLCVPAVASEGHAGGTLEIEGLDPLATSALNARRAVARDCTARVLAGRSGVATSRYVAAADGQVTFRLRGRGDWDLAVFDRGGELVSSSAAFGGNEVAQVGLTKGTAVLVQACRRTGRGSSASLTSQLARVDWSAAREAKGAVRLVRVLTTSREHIVALEHLGFDVTHDVNDRGPAVVVYGDAELAKLEKLGLPLETIIGDMGADAARQRAEQEAWARQVGRSELPSGRTDYRVLADYQRELKELAEKHSEIVRPFNLSEKSFQGRDLQALEITEGAQSGDDGRPVLWLNGIHHAREWPAAESIMEFAHELVSGYGRDPRITKILRDTRIIVQPFTNPDGFIVSRDSIEEADPDEETDVGYLYTTTTGVVIFGGSLNYKRKNCNPLVPDATGAYPCELAIGVDNNRNYAQDWGGPGASTNPNDQGYRGPAPFSEPETRAIQHLSSTMNVTVNLSMHNVAAKVLRPPGLEEDDFAPDEEGLAALGQLIADATGYKNEHGWKLYDTTGTSKDWEYGALGQYAYTVELGPERGQFHGNYKRHVVDQYDGSGEREGLREGFMAAAEWTRDTTRTSRIAGRSIPGRTLRITKAFETETSEVCPVVDPLAIDPIEIATGDNIFYCAGPKGPVQKVPEKVDITMTVPASGTFEWFVNPSTRPFVMRAGGRETYTLTCEQDGKVIETREVFVARGDVAQLDLPCGGVLPDPLCQYPPEADARCRKWVPQPLPAPADRVPSTVKQDGLSVRVLSLKRFGKRARIVLSVTGGTLRGATVTLLDRRGRKVGAKRVKTLAGRRTVVVRSRTALRRGTYRVRVTAAGVKATRTARMR